MRIRMLRTAAGPDGVFNAGKEYDVPARLGKQFIDGGAAELPGTVVETATAAPQDVETAAEPKADTTKPKKPGRPKKTAEPKADSGDSNK